jgi:hypothetical protein
MPLTSRRFISRPRKVCVRAPGGTFSREEVEMSDHFEYDPHHVTHEPEHDSWVGYAAIKYSAIVIIVLAILAFLAWYVMPRIP